MTSPGFVADSRDSVTSRSALLQIIQNYPGDFYKLRVFLKTLDINAHVLAALNKKYFGEKRTKASDGQLCALLRVSNRKRARFLRENSSFESYLEHGVSLSSNAVRMEKKRYENYRRWGWEKDFETSRRSCGK